MTATVTATGWRVFSVDNDGALIPPFVRRYWTEQERPGDVWQAGTNVARCLIADHDAPDEDCTCGFRATLDLRELLAAVARPFAGTTSVSRDRRNSTGSILDECGVLALVEVTGTVLLGVNVPADDPVTTRRASHARLLEVHLAPEHTGKAEAIAARYALPRIVMYSGGYGWPDKVAAAPTEANRDPNPAAFLAEVVSAGFGRKDLSASDAPATILAVGQSVADALRGGVPVDDLVRGLFDSTAHPTRAQAVTLVESALRHLASDCVAVRGHLVTTPINLRDQIGRMGANAVFYGRSSA